MQTLQEMERKLKTVADLQTVVKTMKSMAAVNLRHYEEAARSLEEYFATVELGLRAILRERPPLGRQPLPKEEIVIVFGSDQGMAGRFNDALLNRIIEDFKDEKPAGGKRRFWLVGGKALAALEDSFGPPEHLFPLPPSPDGIADQVQELLLAFEAHRPQKGDARLTLFHNAPTGGIGYGQQRVTLLPPDRNWLAKLGERRWPTNQLPHRTLSWEALFGALLGEYLFAGLYRAFAASMAAENAARLASMQRAEKNIEERHGDLTADYHALRQNSISEELSDILSGFEVLSR
ncbi:MAG: F0F1 ATP synthase subunit gamma [Deltaproteobacteria bacterium]|nr:F0F1 ATP synthase subunit gamma [Deltaproteobacteria bacterium]